MKKDSSEQYLKYLGALALTVAAPATAAQPEAVPASSDTQEVQAQVSQNLQTLAAHKAASVPPSWPESTYVRRVMPLPPPSSLVERQAPVGTSLTQLVDELSKKSV